MNRTLSSDLLAFFECERTKSGCQLWLAVQDVNGGVRDFCVYEVKLFEGCRDEQLPTSECVVHVWHDRLQSETFECAGVREHVVDDARVF